MNYSKTGSWIVFSLLILSTVLLTVSCSDEEKLIDNTKTEINLLVARDGGNPKVELLKLPKGEIVSSDIISGNNDFSLTAKVGKMKSYRNMLYLLVPSEYKILAFNLKDFKLMHEFNFEDDLLEPTDICFLPNGTAAYVSHGNDSSITLLDIYNFKVARNIKVGKNPKGITCSGNQVLVANYGDNTVSIVDSRTHEVSAVLVVHPKPLFIDVAFNGVTAAVVSVGNGKGDTFEEKTPAMISFINIESRKVESNVEIGYQVNTALEQIPTGLGISETDWAFIPTNELMVRSDLRRKDRVLFVSRAKYSNALYNFSQKQMWFVRIDGEKYKLLISNQTTGSTGSIYDLGNDITGILPL